MQTRPSWMALPCAALLAAPSWARGPESGSKAEEELRAAASGRVDEVMYNSGNKSGAVAVSLGLKEACRDASCTPPGADPVAPPRQGLSAPPIPEAPALLAAVNEPGPARDKDAGGSGNFMKSAFFTGSGLILGAAVGFILGGPLGALIGAASGGVGGWLLKSLF